MAASKHVYAKGERVEFSSLDRGWVEILFGIRCFPPNIGLFYVPVLGSPIVVKKRITLATLMLENELRGIQFNLSGMEFYLSMDVKERAFKTKHPAYANILHQPKGLDLDTRPGRVQIFWD